MNQIFLETRMFRLLYGEKIMTPAFFVLIQYRSVTDGRTDRHLCSGYTSACIARYANALLKTSEHLNKSHYQSGFNILKLFRSFFVVIINYAVITNEQNIRFKHKK